MTAWVLAARTLSVCARLLHESHCGVAVRNNRDSLSSLANRFLDNDLIEWLLQFRLGDHTSVYTQPTGRFYVGRPVDVERHID